MANTPVAILDDTMSDIADAIRAKTGSQATMKPGQMAGQISGIPVGSSGLPREVTPQGAYSFPSQSFTYSLPSNATNLGEYSLYYAFYKCGTITAADLSSLTALNNARDSLGYAFSSCPNITSVDMSSLISISNSTDCCSNVCRACDNLQSVDLSSLTTVNAGGAFGNAFANNPLLTTVKLNNLTTIGSGANNAFSGTFSSCPALASIDLGKLVSTGTAGYVFQSAFSTDTSLASADLSSLETVNGAYAFYNTFLGTALTSLTFTSLNEVKGNYAFRYCFQNCSSLIALSFPALTASSFGSYTNQFNNMLSGCSGVTVHFPATIQSTIGSWSDVTNGFGGTNTTVSFDL